MRTSNKSVSLNKGKLPREKNTIIKRNLKKMKTFTKKRKVQRGVVYLAHIPHGFYEEQIDRYFSQFGKVTNVSVPRSKTGRCKGFAFIEFKNPEVAEIAAETMNNYLTFNRLLKAKYIPPKQQKPYLFVSANKAKVTNTTVPEKAKQAVVENRAMKNRHLDNSSEIKLAKRLLRRTEEFKTCLKRLGLDCKFKIQKGNVHQFLEKGSN